MNKNIPVNLSIEALAEIIGTVAALMGIVLEKELCTEEELESAKNLAVECALNELEDMYREDLEKN